MPSFMCPSCSKKYTVKDELAGKQVKCPCGTTLIVPGGPASAPTPQQKGPACPSCGKPREGGAVICIGCGYNYQTGEKMGGPGQGVSIGPAAVPPSQSRGQSARTQEIMLCGGFFVFGLIVLYVMSSFLADKKGGPPFGAMAFAWIGSSVTGAVMLWIACTVIRLNPGFMAIAMTSGIMQLVFFALPGIGLIVSIPLWWILSFKLLGASFFETLGIGVVYNIMMVMLMPVLLAAG